MQALVVLQTVQERVRHRVGLAVMKIAVPGTFVQSSDARATNSANGIESASILV